MNTVLPLEFDTFVKDRVASGAYPSEMAVLRMAFGLLERREQLLARIDTGTQQLQAGEFSEYGEGDVERFVADIAALAEQRRGTATHE